MRICARCGYQDADSLAYCFRCGRRFGAHGSGTPTPSGSGGIGGRGATGGAGENPTVGFAATVALPTTRRSEARASGGAPPGATPPVLRRAFGALAYLFAYVRGRIDAEERKRTLGEERRGAERMIDATLSELGAAIAASSSPPPALADAVAAVVAARERQRTAAGDLANAEKLQAAEDLRLGMAQAAAESEWLACVRGAEEMDRVLRDPAHVGDELATMRERASALRASTTAARSKLDQATTARRTAASAMAAGFAAQTRARAEAERAVADLTIATGRRALELRLPGADLVPRYERIDRLRKTISEADSAVAHLDRHIGGYDNRKLTAGAGVLVLLVAVTTLLVVAVWAMLR